MRHKGRLKRLTRKTRKLDLSSPARARALEVLSRMRVDKLSLTKAAERAETSIRTVRKYVGNELRKSEGGRYLVTPSDRLKRTLNFLTERGPRAVDTWSSRTASKIAAYSGAVDRFLKSGDPGGLAAFAGKSIRAGRATLPFITDLDVLERLGNAGVVSFEDLYANTF